MKLNDLIVYSLIMLAIAVWVIILHKFAGLPKAVTVGLAVLLGWSTAMLFLYLITLNWRNGR